MKTTVADVLRKAENLYASTMKDAEKAHDEQNMFDINFYSGARMALIELIGYMQQAEENSKQQMKEKVRNG